MKKPKFEFGQIVYPTLKAFQSGVFNWNKRESIIGLVVWCEGLEVRVVLKGHKRPTGYHVDFWATE